MSRSFEPHVACAGVRENERTDEKQNGQEKKEGKISTNNGDRGEEQREREREMLALRVARREGGSGKKREMASSSPWGGHPIYGTYDYSSTVVTRTAQT